MSRHAQLVDAALAHSPAQWVATRRANDRLVVLAYHDVQDRDTFAVHLDELQTQTTPVSIDEVRASLKGKPLSRRPVLVTFDDGDRSVVDVALPLLRERAVPAVAFVVAGLVGTDNPPWWREVEALVAPGAGTPSLRDANAVVRELKTVDDEARRAAVASLRDAAPGITISEPQLTRADLRALEAADVVVGNHTMSHPCLDHCDDETLEREIIDAHERLAELLGHEPNAFAYPNGDWDRRAEAVLTRCGYELAFLFDHRVARLPITAPFRVSRVRVDSTTTLDRFRLVLSGLHPALHRAIGRR